MIRSTGIGNRDSNVRHSLSPRLVFLSARHRRSCVCEKKGDRYVRSLEEREQRERSEETRETRDRPKLVTKNKNRTERQDQRDRKRSELRRIRLKNDLISSLVYLSIFIPLLLSPDGFTEADENRRYSFDKTENIAARIVGIVAISSSNS